jgi:hypothetical protein
MQAVSFPGYAAIDVNNLALTSRGAAPGTARQFLCTWNPELPEDDTDTFLVVLGPEDAGDASVKKWWRGLIASGKGTATALVFNYSNLNQPSFIQESTFNLADDATQQNVLPFLRGTKGYFITVFLMVQGRLDWVELISQPIGTPMGAP